MTIPTPSSENMTREVKAKYLHGKLEPMEDLELSEGEEVTISVKRPAKSPEEMGEPVDGFERAAGRRPRQHTEPVHGSQHPAQHGEGL